MSLRNHITTVAIELFSRKGIRHVSMDDVAREANVSKRTLYDFFNDKESLLSEAIDHIGEPYLTQMELLENKPFTALDVILLVLEKMNVKRTWLCEDFFKDIVRHPKAYQVLLDGQHVFLNKIIELLKRGVKEAVFMSDINFDIISTIAHQHLNAPGPPPTFGKYTPQEVNQTIFLIFLRGICTNEGRATLDKFVMKEKYKQHNVI